MTDAATNAALQRGIAYLHRKQWQQASAALKQVLDEHPSSIPGNYWMAFCQSNLGKSTHARRHLELILEVPRLDDAWRVRTLRLLANVSINAGDYALAADCLDQAFKLTGARGAPILNQLARVFCKSGDFGRAFDLYSRAMKG